MRTIYFQNVKPPYPDLEEGWIVREWPAGGTFNGLDVAFIGSSMGSHVNLGEPTIIPLDLFGQIAQAIANGDQIRYEGIGEGIHQAFVRSSILEAGSKK